jgi:N,N-dimethylformamidase
MVPLLGYSDRTSVAPGETIRFMVSSAAAEPFEAMVVRVLCGDSNPHGPGYREREVDTVINRRFPSRVQPTFLGSYVRCPAFDTGPAVAIRALVWPTLPGRGAQAIVSQWDGLTGRGFVLGLDPQGHARLEVGDGRGDSAAVRTRRALRTRTWYLVTGRIDVGAGKIVVRAEPIAPTAADLPVDESAATHAALPFAPGAGDVLVAAASRRSARGPAGVSDHFNGKIEAPALARPGPAGTEEVLLALDFAQDMSGTRAVDTGPHGRHGLVVNLPARAMRGARWSGKVMNWAEAPEEYAAIHFHADDIYDCGWEPDVVWRVPDDFASGLYCLRLRAGGHEDHVLFVVRPRRGAPRAQALFVVPSFTYVAYCNFASPGFEPRSRQRVADWGCWPWLPNDVKDYGVSTYDHHTDGSGVCYSSRLRPNLNMRPRFLAATDPRGSGLRHFAADTYVTAWLDHVGEPYDVVCDEDLHEEGAALLAPYRVVITGTHPEYHTPETLAAFQAHVDGGGRLMYLGGNGFYWKIAVHPQLPGVIELRRAEGGIRLWASEPGEYYHSFDGSYGGLWRRNGRPPDMLTGVGFTSQGNYEGSYYVRQPGSRDPRAAFIFDGVGPDEIIGDFGFFGGGAAGFELDRADPALGTAPHALVLASSENHGPMFQHVNEELLRQFSHRPRAEVVRADMVFFETPRGGAVFSVGSITYCGALPYNSYRNNVARITTNVLRRFLDPAPFPPP